MGGFKEAEKLKAEGNARCSGSSSNNNSGSIGISSRVLLVTT